MPMFQVDGEELRPFARLNPGPDLYEREIEELAWSDLEAFTGQVLFPVARQPRISAGGRPDILALGQDGSVVIIEVKRDIDRGQLAQVLEYAGWGRSTNLDEIADLYNISKNHRGPDKFFADWVEFTETPTPVLIKGPPRLVLIARDFQSRTREAFAYLEETGVPVALIPVSMYHDPSGNKVVNVDAEHEVMAGEAPTAADKLESPPITVNGQRVSVQDLLEADHLVEGEVVVFNRPLKQERYEARINGDGTFTLADGRTFNSPSVAAMRAAGLVSYDGWHAWRVPRLNHKSINELRIEYVADRLRQLSG